MSTFCLWISRKWHHTELVLVCPPSFTQQMSSGVVHVAARVRTSPLSPGAIPSCGCTTFRLAVHRPWALGLSAFWLQAAVPLCTPVCACPGVPALSSFGSRSAPRRGAVHQRLVLSNSFWKHSGCAIFRSHQECTIPSYFVFSNCCFFLAAFCLLYVFKKLALAAKWRKLKVR